MRVYLTFLSRACVFFDVFFIARTHNFHFRFNLLIAPLTMQLLTFKNNKNNNKQQHSVFEVLVHSHLRASLPAVVGARTPGRIYLPGGFNHVARFLSVNHYLPCFPFVPYLPRWVQSRRSFTVCHMLALPCLC
jgi:hypothetical protein